METRYTIDGRVIKRPWPFKIERYNITTLTRLANGNMSGNLIAQKRKFFYTYESINSQELNVILDAIWRSKKIFFPITYVEDNQVQTATVYAGAIPQELYRTGSIWYWKDVSFNLIEK